MSNQFIPVQNEQLSLAFARVHEKVYELRKFKDDSTADLNTKTVFLFWYSPRKKKFQCHLLGKLVCGDSLADLIVEAQNEFVEIYNTHFQTNKATFDECDFVENPSDWSKAKLLAEYLRLSKKVGKNHDLKPKEKKKLGRPKKVIKPVVEQENTQDKHQLRYEQTQDYPF